MILDEFKQWVSRIIHAKPFPTEFDTVEDYYEEVSGTANPTQISNQTHVYGCFAERMLAHGIPVMMGEKRVAPVDGSYVPDFARHRTTADVTGWLGLGYAQPIDLCFDMHRNTVDVKQSIAWTIKTSTKISAAIIYEPPEKGGELICWCPVNAFILPGSTLTIEWPITGLFTIS